MTVRFIIPKTAGNYNTYSNNKNRGDPAAQATRYSGFGPHEAPDFEIFENRNRKKKKIRKFRKTFKF